MRLISDVDCDVGLNGYWLNGSCIFTEDAGIIHSIVSLVAFLFSGLSAIFAAVCSHLHEFKLIKMPFSIIAIILGLTTLRGLALFVGKIYLGLGVGGMECMVVYPALMWGAGFGVYLMAHPEKPIT